MVGISSGHVSVLLLWARARGWDRGCLQLLWAPPGEQDQDRSSSAQTTPPPLLPLLLGFPGSTGG